jgi:hypothetical protein
LIELRSTLFELNLLIFRQSNQIDKEEKKNVYSSSIFALFGEPKIALVVLMIVKLLS